jgi:ubiquitin-conjugating enzyme E2 O
VVDPQYEIVKTTELQPSAEELLEEKQILELVAQVEKPNVSSEDDIPKRFDIVADYSDHHFLKENGQKNVTRAWAKKVQQEWAILQNDLPDGIHVRVYEERMDLLRACIVGAEGTPYHDSLFFFDIFFPPDYPHEPPSVHYHSGGLRLNPNLYESGKVCLSLLKTWAGTGNEVWNPESSTVLQLLLSLQALVLNGKPYFNEAGYDKFVGKADGEKNSITYNENAFLLSCKSMMYVLQKPPKHFEKFVKDHFTYRAPCILNACEAYLGGDLVGHAHDSTCMSEDGSKNCSTGFKIMLGKLLPKLASTFTEAGIVGSQ